jgi:hypothetical protein
MVDRKNTRHYWCPLGEFGETGEVHPRNWNNDSCCFMGLLAENSAANPVVVAAEMVVSVVDWIVPAGVV